MRLVRWLIGGGYALAALLFALLPFVTMGSRDAAGDTTRWTWIGRTCLLGGYPALHVEEQIYDPGLGRYVATDVTGALQNWFRDLPPLLPQPLFMAAALFVVAGFAGAVLLTAPARPLIFAVAGIGGAVTLVVAQINVMNVLHHGVLAATVGPPTAAYGFWIVDGLLLVLGLAGTVLTTRRFLTPAPASPPEVPDLAPAEPVA